MQSKPEFKAPPKGVKDSFAEFFEDPSRETFRSFLQKHLGESRQVDFKSEWLHESKLAKLILGFSNTGPGCIVFGVHESVEKNLEPVGLSNFEDKADIQNRLRKYRHL